MSTQEEHLVGVHRIINSASVLEDPKEIEKEHDLQEEIRMQTIERSFENAKYYSFQFNRFLTVKRTFKSLPSLFVSSHRFLLENWSNEEVIH